MDGGCLWVAWMALAWAAVLGRLSRETVLMTLDKPLYAGIMFAHGRIKN